MHRFLRTGLVVLLLAAACSSSDSGSPSTTPSPSTGPAPTTAATSTTGSSTTAPSTTTTVPATTTTDAAVDVDFAVEVATINVLHGIPGVSDCGPDTDQCHAPTRLAILWDQLETDVGCPEIIALQEISARWFEIVPEMLPELCDGEHVLLTEDLGLADQEMILTTLPVIDHQRLELAGAPIWSAHWAQLDAGDGLVVDVFASHYASKSFNPPCDDSEPLTTCHPSCPQDGDLGSCHPHETLAFLDERAAPGSLQLVVGDLNKEVHEPRILTLLDAGFEDTHLLAGNPECAPEGGPNCTTGLDGDTELNGLDLPDLVAARRIDFVLARPPAGCTLHVDPDDVDGDGTRTELWADEPLAEPRDGLYWASDHTGIQADIGLTCD